MNRYSTLGKRILALIIDALVFTPVIAAYLLVDELDLPISVEFILIPLSSVLGIGYNVLLHWKYGQTIGKMAAKVKVLDISEQPITFKQAFLRDIAYIVDGFIAVLVLYVLLASGYGPTSETYVNTNQYLVIPLCIWFVVDTIVCIKSKKKRALHDFIAGTVVVRLDMVVDNAAGKKLEPPGPEHYSGLLEK